MTKIAITRFSIRNHHWKAQKLSYPVVKFTILLRTHRYYTEYGNIIELLCLHCPTQNCHGLCIIRIGFQATISIFEPTEPTCAICRVGSYASLSVCCLSSVVCRLSGLDQKSQNIIHISESIVGIRLKLHHHVEHFRGILKKYELHSKKISCSQRRFFLSNQGYSSFSSGENWI